MRKQKVSGHGMQLENKVMKCIYLENESHANAVGNYRGVVHKFCQWAACNPVVYLAVYFI